MKILITGATGLIGQEIIRQCLDQNIDVNYLTTKKTKQHNKVSYRGFYWNPDSGFIDSSCFSGVEVIINLAGASIAKKWTSKYKQYIKSSRIKALQLLFKTIDNDNIPIKHIVSASAIGIYPDSQTHFYEEDSEEYDNSFLADVVSCWEQEVDRFKAINIMVAKIRIGIVLSKNGGVLPKLERPIKLYFGSVLGNGKQWQSWIHIKDLAALFLFIIKEKLEGVYNGVAPNAISQKEFLKKFAVVLKKPILLPGIPTLVINLLMGDMSTLVLASQHVSSKKIEIAGFNFEFTHLNTALFDLYQ